MLAVDWLQLFGRKGKSKVQHKTLKVGLVRDRGRMTVALKPIAKSDLYNHQMAVEDSLKHGQRAAGPPC